MTRRLGHLAGLAMVCGFMIAAAGGALADQPIAGGIDLQPSATPIMTEVRWFHHAILLPIIGAVTLFVLVLLSICIVRYNARANPTPSKTTHNVMVEVVWTIAPILILIVIAIPSFQLLYRQQTVPPADLTVKITGQTFAWGYAYPDHGNFEFRSSMLEDADRAQAAQQLGRPIEQMPRLLAVDNEMVVPVGRTVRIQVTSSDVIHAFAMPAFGIKIDAVPGRLNEGWFRAERPGVYYGQCSELCGSRHAFMPIAIRVVSEQDFASWVEDARRRYAADPPTDRSIALATAR